MAKTSKPGAKNAKGKYKNPTAAINSGKMEKKSGEIVSPGKIISKAAAKLAGTKAAKAVSKTNSKSSRQAGDYAVSGKSAKDTMMKTGKAPDGNYRYGRDSQISENVSIKDTVSPSGKEYIRGGAAQVMNQNSRLSAKANKTKAEAKANARGLKAANKKKRAR